MTIYDALKQYFGYDSFRDGQEELINGILENRDVLGVMPTGSGKSICFQIPALMKNGLALIISPLISLMKDQVNALTQSGISAAYINSSLTENQIKQALSNARNNKYKLIYVAPERLLTDDFMDFAENADISLLTIDEAHCISQWGHDFRPSYTKIPEFVDRLQKRPVISAFTATATLKVREDIIELLKLIDPIMVCTGFDRPNLYFEVQRPKDKFAKLLSFLEDKKDVSGIVYCSTRKTVEDVCEKLNTHGYKASKYHAGLTNHERHENQENFIYDRIQIMVATNAFGMGIDKSNVSFVVHYNMPKDVEGYYQEAGRAGRDGEPSHCLLLYSGQDVRTNLWLIENGNESEGIEDVELRERLMARNRLKLKEMTFYCTTSGCLREYILRYFNESAKNDCGKCGNCDTNFETLDITIISQKILSCVARMNERYGITMLIDTLRGSKNEKIIRLGLDKLSTYGICNESEPELRDIVYHLILVGYLVQTDDQYPVIKLGKHADDILRKRCNVQMKLSKDIEPALSKSPSKNVVRSFDKRLFEVLRSIRADIAKEENVPAFVIFHDSTLTDICLKLPKTKDEFLKVSGVGNKKAERYGLRFLDAVTDYMRNKNQDDKDIKKPMVLDISEIEVSDDFVTVSVIADRINCVLLQYGHLKISGQKINDMLISNGYMKLIQINDKNHKVPTKAGEELGISSEVRVIRGTDTQVNVFSSKAQKYIINAIVAIYK